jgi:hypothetical protein
MFDYNKKMTPNIRIKADATRSFDLPLAKVFFTFANFHCLLSSFRRPPVLHVSLPHNVKQPGKQQRAADRVGG